MTYIAQLMLVGQLRQLQWSQEVAGYIQYLWRLAWIILFTGLLSVVLGVMMKDYGRIEDAFEWLLSAMFQIHFIFVGAIWHKESEQIVIIRP